MNYQDRYWLAVTGALETIGEDLPASQIKEIARRLVDEKAHGYSAFHSSSIAPEHLVSDVKDVLAAMRKDTAEKKPKGESGKTFGVDTKAYEALSAQEKLRIKRRYEAEHGKPTPKSTAKGETGLLAERRGLMLLASGSVGERREAALRGLEEVNKKLAELKR